MKSIYFLSDDETGKLAIARINTNDFERALAKEAEKHGMPDPDSGNLTWGTVSAISINL